MRYDLAAVEVWLHLVIKMMYFENKLLTNLKMYEINQL